MLDLYDLLTPEKYFDIIRYGAEGISLLVAASTGVFNIGRFQRSRQKSAEEWPSTEGTIQWAKVDRMPHSSRIFVTLTYSYYAGEYRAGEFLQEFRGKQEAIAFSRNMKDRKLLIRYKPSDPETSIIDANSMRQHFMVP